MAKNIPFDPRHASVAAHFCALLKADTREPQIRMALEHLEGWALGDARMGFGPTSAVDGRGRVLAQAVVLELDAVDPDWLRGWVGRHGVQALYPKGLKDADNPLVVAMDNTLKLLAGRHGSLYENRARTLVALVELAPDWALDPSRAGRWRERWATLPAPGHSFSDGPEQRDLVAQALAHRCKQDPEQDKRPVERWVQEDGDPSLSPGQREQVVRCVSGRERTLGQLHALGALGGGYYDRRGLPASPSQLPVLPHGRRRELLEDWVLDETVDVDTTRARLWACALKKPEVLELALNLLRKAPDSAWGKRAWAALTARDAAGRSFAAFLATRAKAADPSDLLSWLIDRMMKDGMCSPADLLTEQGDGLLAQAVWGARNGMREDAFESHSRGLNQVKDPYAILGRAELVQDLVDDFIDAIACGQHSADEAKVLEQTLGKVNHLERVRLEQALLWHGFNEHMAELARDIRQPPQRRRGGHWGFEDRTPRVNGGHAEKLVEHIQSHGMLLAVGEAEWRQWGGLGRDLALSHESIAQSIGAQVEALERSVGALEAAECLAQAPVARKRAGPRL